MIKAVRFWVVMYSCLVINGCVAPEFLAHPDIHQRVPQLKKIALLPPRVDVYEIGAGGVLEKIDDWSRNATENVSRGFASELEGRQGVEVVRMDVAALPELIKTQLDQTQLLFDAVRASVETHLYGIPAQRFDDKVTNFDYSLGAETAKINIMDADAFLIAKGFDQVSSLGRHAVQATTTIVAAALGGVVIPQGGITGMDVALVDARTGEILWFMTNRAGGTDLRKPWGANAFVRGSLTGFPLQ